MNRVLLVFVPACLLPSYIRAEVSPDALRLLSAQGAVPLVELALPAAAAQGQAGEVVAVKARQSGAAVVHTVVHTVRSVSMRLVAFNGKAVFVADIVAVVPTTVHIVDVFGAGRHVRGYWVESKIPSTNDVPSTNGGNGGDGSDNKVLCSSRVVYR